MPMKTAVKSANTYACTRTTMTSRPEMRAAIGTDSSPIPMPASALPNMSANMTGGHIAILAILSFVFLFAEMGGALAGIGAGLAVSVPLAVGISALEIIVVLVQAYVFTLLTAVFIGMAIHVHH